MGGGRGLKRGLTKLDTKNCSSFSDRILLLDSSLAKSQFERYNFFTRLLRRDASSGSETHQQSARDIAHVRHSAVEETLTQRPPGPRPPRTYTQSSITVTRPGSRDVLGCTPDTRPATRILRSPTGTPEIR